MREDWYKGANLYCLDVDTFQDGNGDGIGDFTGLLRRLDYIAGLGATCLWLLPFYPSPNRHNGYDVMDYYGVDPYTHLHPFRDFLSWRRGDAVRLAEANVKFDILPEYFGTAIGCPCCSSSY